VYSGSIPDVASIHIINDLDQLYQRLQQAGRDQQAAYEPSNFFNVRIGGHRSILAAANQGETPIR
jgi:hypothetical protein